MAKKARKPVVDLAVYVVVRMAVCVLTAVPLKITLGFAHLLAWFAYTVDKRHREVARDNLRHAFPERCADPVECDRLVKACYLHFCTVLMEIVCFPRRITLRNWRRYVDDRGIGKISKELVSPRGVLMVTCHFGNWEVAGYITGLTGFRTYAIARVLDNPYLDQFLKRFRQKTGQTILAKTGDFELIDSVLKNHGALATLGDQDAGPKGLFVDFFNRPASTHKAVALMAIQYDVPMVVLASPRVGTPMKFALVVADVIDPREYQGSRVDAVRQITERFTQAFERMIRDYPEQYFWLHRRWKHKPPEKKKSLKTTDSAISDKSPPQ